MPKEVTITLPLEQAKQLSHGASDLLCWVRGYVSAKPDDPNGPFGQEEVRVLNRKLKDAMHEAQETE